MNKTLSAAAIGLLTVGANLAANAAACPELYNHQFKTLQGQQINLCDFPKTPKPHRINDIEEEVILKMQADSDDYMNSLNYKESNRKANA